MEMQSREGIFRVQWGCICLRIVIEFNKLLMEHNCFPGTSFFHGCFDIRSNLYIIIFSREHGTILQSSEKNNLGKNLRKILDLDYRIQFKSCEDEEIIFIEC
jgi:hypothetical protein